MDRKFLSIIVLAVIILLFIVCLWLYRNITSKKKKVLEGFDASDGLAIDTENPNLSVGALFGTVPQSVSIALHKKAQLRGALDNIKDTLKNSSGLPKLSLQKVNLAKDVNDIENVLQAKIDEQIQKATGTGVTLADIKKNLKGSVKTMATAVATNAINNKIKDQLGIDLTVDDIKANPAFAAKMAGAAFASKELAAKFGIEISPDDMAANPVLAAKTAAAALANKEIADKLGINVTVEQIQADPALAAKTAALALANKELADKLGITMTVEDMAANPALAAKTAAKALANKELHDQLGIDVTVDDMRANPGLAAKVAISQLASKAIQDKFGVTVTADDIRNNPALAIEMAGEQMAQNAINKQMAAYGFGDISLADFKNDPIGASKKLLNDVKNKAIDMAKDRAKELIADYSKQAGKIIVQNIEKQVETMSKRMATEMGEKQAEKMMESVVEHQVEVIGERVAVSEAEEAAVEATAPATFGIGAAIGLLMQAMTVAAQALTMAMQFKLKGEQGTCPPNMHTITEKMPSWCLDLIGAVPSVGELFVAMFPYMCFSEANCIAGEEQLDGGLCYPNCDVGYDGVGPICWSHYETIGVGVLKGCPPGWTDDGLMCREPITFDPCPSGWTDDGALCRAPLTYKPCPKGWNEDGCCSCRAPLVMSACPNGWSQDGCCSCRAPLGWNNCCSKGLFGECYGCATGGQVEPRKSSGGQVQPREMDSKGQSVAKVSHGGRVIGKMNAGKDGGDMLKCPSDHPDYIDGLCYRSCPTKTQGAKTVTRQIPKWIRNRPFPNRDAAQKALDAEKKKDKPDINTLNNLQKALGDANEKDLKATLPAGTPYVLNPEWTTAKKQGFADMNMKEGFGNTPLRVVAKPAPKPAPKPVAPPPPPKPVIPVPVPKAAAPAPAPTPIPVPTIKPVATGDTPPDPKTPEYKIEFIEVKTQVPGSVQLTHAPGAPYQCVGTHGTSYGRGVGRPAITMVVQSPPSLPDIPPAYLSSHYADDPATTCVADYSSDQLLNDMCQFYYDSSIHVAATDGTSKTFDAITKITGVVASSEQSADVLCEITTIVINGETGATISNSVKSSAADRRFYFAKIDSICSFVVTACTNVDGSGPDVKSATTGVKTVSFKPTFSKCSSMVMTTAKCSDEISVKVMMAAYGKTAPNAKVLSVDAGDATGPAQCTMTWTEADGSKKAGIFDYTQADDCSYKLSNYTATDPTKTTVSALANPVMFTPPLPPEVSLNGCPGSYCRDAVLVQRMITAFNNASQNKIQSINKAITPAPLRCEIEAAIMMADSKQVKTQTVGFDLVKSAPGICLFDVKKVGEIGSGTNIKPTTPTLKQTLDPKGISLITQAVNSTVSALGLSTKKISNQIGASTTVHDKTLSELGQKQTLGNCEKKCSDPDVLEAITTYYNNINYPTTRSGVTKKTMKRILKAGTASATECDITFEESQEVYSDLYGSDPAVSVTQKTQRFTVGDTDGNCVFDVVPPATTEGFRGGRSVSGFQSGGGLPGFKTPSTVNPSTPAMNPPYTNTGCQLVCEDPQLLIAMKQKISSAQIDGFKGRMSSQGGWFSSLFEAFQDSSDDSAPADDSAPVAEDDTEPTVNDETSPVDAPAPTPKVIATTTMKKVNRALKLDMNRCEYEVVYDATNVDTNGNSTQVNNGIGYYQATFKKDPSACTFTVSAATKMANPILPSVPANKSISISYTF